MTFSGMSAGSPGSQFFVTALSAAQTTLLTQVFAFIFLAYDCAVTFSDEVQTVWTLRWTVPKALFFFIRYYGLGMLLSDAVVSRLTSFNSSFCQGWVMFTTGNHIVFISLFVNMLFMLRLFALFGRARWIMVLLGSFYLAEFGLGFTHLILSNVKPLRLPTSGFHDVTLDACLASLEWNWSAVVVQIMCLMRSVIYFGLTLYKSFLLRQRQSSEMSARGGPASLVGTFVRDEAAVFLVLSALQTVQTVTTLVPSFRMYQAAVFQFFLAAAVACASRIVLNVQVTYAAATAGDASAAATVAPPRPSMNPNRVTITSWTSPSGWKGRDRESNLEAEFEFVKPPTLSRTGTADSESSETPMVPKPKAF